MKNSIVEDLLEKLKQCDDFHNRCDYLLEHDETTYLLDYITNLQTIEREYSAILSENAELQQENESLRTRIKTIKRLRKKQTQKKNKYKSIIFDEEQKLKDYKSRCEKASEQAKEKIKRYESYINDLKKGNYPSSTIKQERQELIFRIREQEDLLNILQNGSDSR